MADDKEPKRGGQPKKYETLLVRRVIRIVDQSRTLIKKHGPRLLERDAVLRAIGGGFAFIPLEPELVHRGIITTL
jgi:hypothetical protein